MGMSSGGGGFVMDFVLGGKTQSEMEPGISRKMEMDSNHFLINWDFKINTEPP